ncbi:hypothetical protein PIB30_096007 [Stylosanthes scabra]|uniref:Putative plant transposon protein domain-containing protein n=1 Tax=Stylosanthes scabra TaxID=79078 RepID=A0ABU6UYJ8_9FABA|nr:hypothetical protein [Stylosanthes scabra]
MASSSAPLNVFDEHRFWKEFNQQLFESHAKRRKVILEVGFNLDEGEYPQIMEQILLRGWRRLAAPMTGVSKLLVQEFYANATVSDEEVVNEDQLPYKSFVRGIKVDFSLENIRRVMRFKSSTAGAETDYKTCQASDQRLDEVLADLCIPGVTWKQSSGQPAVPIQLRMTELHPLAKGWQEFIIHSLVLTGNKFEVSIARAILIHSIMRGEEVRAKDIIADNMAVIAQGLQSKGNLGFPSTIYKLCKDAGVPLREFRRTSKIPEEKYITAKRMESTRIPRICHKNKGIMMKMNQCLKREEAMMKKRNNNNTMISSSHHSNLSWIFSNVKSQADYMEEVRQIKAKQEEMWNNNNRFQSQIRKEQEMLAREIQEVRKSQISQTLVNNKRLEIEKNLQ